MKRLFIYGTGHLDVIKLIDAINRAQPTFEVAGFINDLPQEQNKSFMGYPVVGGRENIAQWAAQPDAGFFNNINSSVKNHKMIAAILEGNGCKVVSLVHPAIDMSYVDCAAGALIPEGCVVGSKTRIGRYFTCRLKSLISHNVTIGDFVYMGPAVTCCGHCVLEDGCFIGAGSTVSTGVTVGAGAVVGAGSLVMKDIPARMLAYGSPAKVVREIGEEERIIPGAMV